MATITAAQFATKTTRMAQSLPRLNAKRVERASLVIVDSYNAAVNARASGGRLRGTARDGRQASRVRATFPTVKVPRNGHVSSLVGARGPAQFLEYPIQQHVIGSTALGTRSAIRRGLLGSRAEFGGSARRTFQQSFRTTLGGRQVQRSTKRALAINGELRAYAFHPGVNRSVGSGPWKRTLPTSKARAEQAMRGVWSDALKVYGR
jgi:hypothetical protein